MRRRESKYLLTGLLVVAIGLLAVPAAGAATINVSTTADEYGENPAACSLREAISSANNDVPFGGCAAGFGPDTIALPAGVYRITRAGAGEDGNSTGDFDTGGPLPLTVEPAAPNAKVTVDGNGLDRVFSHLGPSTLSLRFIQITGGEVTLVEDGGGILVGGPGALAAEGITVSGNSTKFQGGGVAIYSSMTMINSTVSGNSAEQNGGGFYLSGAASATVRSSTITDNTADAEGGGSGAGGGVADAMASSINFHNVINAGNRNGSDSGADDCSTSPFYFPRYVIQTQPLGPAPCLVGFNPGTNQVSDPMLAPLADNGGQTPTHALKAGSPAIGAGGSAAPDQCPPLDQNGRVRAAGSCDIGAVQFFDPPEKPLPGKKKPTKVVATFDGKRLHIRLKCPARFRPRCRSVAVPMTKRKRGKRMGKTKRVVTRANRWKRVTFKIKPAFRERVRKMTFVDRKRLVVRQRIRSKRVFRKKARRRSTVFHTYKVRVKL